MASEFDLWKRGIVHVADYFDEERDLPWNYVRRVDGKFEAVATHLLDHIRGHDEHGSKGVCREHLIGIFDTLDAAVKALQQYLKNFKAADGLPRAPDGRLDFNTPTVH